MVKGRIELYLCVSKYQLRNSYIHSEGAANDNNALKPFGRILEEMRTTTVKCVEGLLPVKGRLTAKIRTSCM